MAEAPGKRKDHLDELRAILWEWDPLGIKGVSEDSYNDFLADPIVNALDRHAGREELKSVLSAGVLTMAGEGYSALAAERETSPERLDAIEARVRAWWATGTLPKS